MSAAPRFGDLREITPHDALQEELHRSATWVAFLEARVAESPSEGLRKQLGVQQRRLANAERTCKQVGISADEIEAAKATGAAEGPQPEWLAR